MHWPIGKTWCHRTIPSAEDWEGFVFHTFYISASNCHYKWHLGQVEKCSHSKLILPFRMQEVKKKWELPAMSPTRSKENSFQVLQGISASHSVFTFADLPSFAEPHKGGQPCESWLGNWDPVLQSHTQISYTEPHFRLLWTILFSHATLSCCLLSTDSRLLQNLSNFYLKIHALARQVTFIKRTGITVKKKIY